MSQTASSGGKENLPVAKDSKPVDSPARTDVTMADDASGSGSGPRNDATSAGGGETAAPSAASSSSPPPRRAASHRPVYKLSVQLIDTYKYINKVYYEKKKKREEERKARNGSRTGVHNSGYDDEHYDYILHHDEVLADRYEVRGRLGKGSFGQVVRCLDRETGKEVALKIIKSKRPFTVQARTEIRLLEQLQQNDPDGEYRTVRMLHTFTFRNHQCIAFELLSCNLYELLRNTNFRGISLNLTRKFARQVLKTLHFLRSLQDPIIHCDLKPENILLCHPRRSAVKVIDFGSACTQNDRMYSYIQSRFYRSPEVMMGLPYGPAIDMWSLGCILGEMHTGEPLFSGRDTQDQMRRIYEMMGMPPEKLIDSSPDKNRDNLFHRSEGRWMFKYKAGQTRGDGSGGPGETLARQLEDVLGVRTGGPGGRRRGEAGHTPAHYQLFLDLLQRMLRYDPEQRLTPLDALSHPFFMQEEEQHHAAQQHGGGGAGPQASVSDDVQAKESQRSSSV